VKRTIIVLAGVMILGLGVYVSNRLWAQTPGGAPPAAAQTKTRVGLINLTYVIKNYNKFKAYQEDLKKTVEPYQAKDTGLKTEAERLAKEGQETKTLPQRRDQIEKRLKEIGREIEDNKNDAQKIVIKKQEDQLKTLYMDVRRVVDKYAQSQALEMVMHYNDAVTDDEYWSPPNIARKMQAGALMPMYMAPGIDISYNIVTTLNSQYPAPAAAGGGAAPGATRPGG